MNSLEDKLIALATAAAEFADACDKEYERYRRNLKDAGRDRPSGEAQIALQDAVQGMLSLKVYTACQHRAIHAAFSTWRPPATRPQLVRTVLK